MTFFKYDFICIWQQRNIKWVCHVTLTLKTYDSYLFGNFICIYIFNCPVAYASLHVEDDQTYPNICVSWSVSAHLSAFFVMSFTVRSLKSVACAFLALPYVLGWHLILLLPFKSFFFSFPAEIFIENQINLRHFIQRCHFFSFHFMWLFDCITACIFFN